MGACLHRYGKRALLCALLPRSGTTMLRASRRRRSRGRLEISRAGAGLRVDTGGLPVRCASDGTLLVGELAIRLVAGRAGPGRWRVAHRCAVRVALVYERPAGIDRLATQAVVTAYAGASRLDLGVRVLATASTTLADGVGIELCAPFLRGADAAGPTGVVSRGPEPWSISVPSGVEQLVVADGRVRALGEVPRTLLDAGEGRIVRATVMPGRVPAAPPAVALPATTVPRAGGGSLLHQASLAPALAAAAGRLVSRFLGDEVHGPIRSGCGRGDWRFDRERVGNGEYDTTLGLLQWARRMGSGEAWVTARRMADHLLSVDLDAVGSGLFFPHGRGHRSAPIEAGHHWIEGMELLQDLEPDPLRGLILKELRPLQASSLGELDLNRQIPRSLGWGLLALSVAADRKGPHRKETRVAVRRWRHHVLEAQTSSGLLALVPLGDHEDLGHENPFVQGGIILPALVRSLRSVPSASDRRATLRLARALAENATHCEGGSRALALRLTVQVPTGRVLARTGRAPGEHAALFLAGLAAAGGSLLSRQQLHDLQQTVPSTLRADRKTYIGPELSILLHALPGLRGR